MSRPLPEPPAVRPDAEAKPRPRKRRSSPLARLGIMVVETLVAVLIALLIAAVLRVFVFQVFKVPSGSMEHTLEEGDRITAMRIGTFQRGDVVVFKDPDATWLGPQQGPTNPLFKVGEGIGLLPNSSQGFLVKRVIGMPGDHVECCDHTGKLSINGVALDESSYLFTDEAGHQVRPSDTPFSVVVPEGTIFVMGDHRNRSADSRIHMCEQASGKAKGEHAFVPLDHVVGPVGATVLPITRIKTFSTPPNFKYIPEPSEPAPDHPVIDPISCQGR